MSTRFFNTIFALMFIPAIMACSLFTSRPAPSQADVEREEQAVYAFFINQNESPALILQDTSTGIGDDDTQYTIDNIKSGLPGISRDTINSYVERNTQPDQLSSDMQLGVDYVLLSQEELSKITRQANWREILAEKYPGSNGYTIFSRVGFNKSLDQAVLYVGQVAGPLMGAGYYYLLEKQNGNWILKDQIMLWIS